MTVYVDDAAIAAKVGRITSRWAHLIADDQAELHAFAARLGLRRAWFQDLQTKTSGVRPTPGSRAAENGHYDPTAGKRMRAIQLGATPVTWRERQRFFLLTDDNGEVVGRFNLYERRDDSAQVG